MTAPSFHAANAPDGASAPAPAAPRGPFAVPIYRNFWIGFLLSAVGSQIQAVGAAWLMTSLTTSTVLVALVQASAVFPMMLLSVLSGALADSFNRRRLMITAQTIMMSVSIALLVMALLDLLTPGLLLAMTFSLGIGLTLNSPAQGASIGDMVPRAVLPSAVAMNSMGFNVARSVGPAVGGIVVAAGGAVWAFGINAASYIVLLLVLFTWKPDYARSTLVREPLGRAMQAGLRYVGMSPWILATIVRGGYFGLFASSTTALLPLVARDLVDGGAGAFGLMSGAFGVGATVGALAIARLRNRLSSEALMRISGVSLALGTAGSAFSTHPALTSLAMILAGVGWMGGLSNCMILVQMASPRWVVGRSLAVFQTFTFGAMGLGALLVGWLASQIGLVETLLLASAFQAGNIAMGFLFRLPDIGNLDTDPLFPSFLPEASVPVDSRSGPVVITREYRIAESDVAAFAQLMHERRRVMRRDGASGWRLLQDLNDGERWVERYEVATWHEYIRQITRRTQDDQSLWESIVALHRGEGLPATTRLVERPTGVPPADSASPIASQPNM